MGHIGIKGLRAAVDGVIFDDSSFHSCVVCSKANIKRSPFPHKASHPSTRVLERIHCDICGPLPPCYGSFRYFILFICCHSCYISLYLMKSRDEAYQHFVTFRSVSEKFCNQTISILRVDNAPELVKGKLESYCKSEGISYEKTVPDSPSQNGVAERCNLTLASMVRAMLLDANLSNWFWPFAIQTAVHIKNCVPHSNLPVNTTPFQYWHGHKPNVSYMRLFGSYCTSRILTPPASKFEPRGESARFMGYPNDAKGYLLWIPGPNGRGSSIKTRRDVTFHGFPSDAESVQSNDTPPSQGGNATPAHNPQLVYGSYAIYFPYYAETFSVILRNSLPRMTTDSCHRMAPLPLSRTDQSCMHHTPFIIRTTLRLSQ
jgi:hypothetical protein